MPSFASPSGPAQAGRLETVRRRVYEIVEAAEAGDTASRVFDVLIMGLICINVVALVLETVESLHHDWPRLFDNVERISIGVFTVEYVLRLWSCTADPRFASPITGRVRFALRPLILIDLLAVLPFYLPFVGLDLRVMWILRFFRLLRFAKLARYSSALQTFGRVLEARREELILSLAFLAGLLLVASSLMYFAEHQAQPHRFSSIPAALWWGVETLSTVGYGDVHPVTAWGKVVAGLVSVVGIGLFAIPTGILGAGFVEDAQRRRREHQMCPHCGKPISPAA